MNKKRFMTIIMTIVMMLSMLPASVFAEEGQTPQGVLNGTLRVKGTAALDATLEADFSQVYPEGLDSEDVNYHWFRKTAESDEDIEEPVQGEVSDYNEDEMTSVGTESTYQVTSEDISSVIVLKITGKEELGVTGTLYAKTGPVTEYGDEGEDSENSEDPWDPEESENFENPEDWENTEEPLNPENPEESWYPQETPQVWDEPQTVEEQPVYQISTDTEVVDFGTISQETLTTSAPVHTITITNKGNQTITLLEPSGTSFRFGSFSNEILEPGDSATFTVTPSEDLSAGIYDDYITIMDQEQKVYVGITMKVQVQENPAVYQLSADMPYVDFGTITKSTLENNTPSQTVVITNSGDQTVSLALPSTEEYVLGEPTQTTLAPGEAAALTVAPAQNLAPGTYTRTITITDTQGYGPVDLTFNITVEEDVQPVYALSVDTQTVDFGTLTTDTLQSQTPQQTVTVTNEGNQNLSVVLPEAVNFRIGALTQTELLPKESAQFTIAPVNTLAAGEYRETLTITDTQQQTSIDVALAINVQEEAPVYRLALDTQAVDFGKVTQNALQSSTPTQTVAITNQGNQSVSLVLPQTDYFWMGDLSQTELAPGESGWFTVSPLTNLAVGNYQNTVTITDSQQNASVNLSLSIQVQEDAYYGLAVSPATLNFGSVPVGYQPTDMQMVTITNTGNRQVQVNAPTASYYAIGKLTAYTLEPGASARFRIRPKNGLRTGNYQEQISITTVDGRASAVLTAGFAVQGNALTGITQPAAISNLPNGTAKTAQAMGLPGKVAISTTAGAAEAGVTWDLNSCSYDPTSTTAQSFTVNGTIALPEGVVNYNNISLAVKVQVTVQGYQARVANPANNQITGINTNGYPAGAQVDFTAIGAGMDNTNPGKGDVRYVPLNWTVKNTYAWNQAPYTGAFKLSMAGDYTLSVTYNRQVFDGSNWTADGQQDVKKVNIHVYQIVTPTPGAAQNTNNGQTQRAGVATGDNTPILLWVVVLIVAAACVAAGVIYMKKKEKTKKK